MVAALIFSLAIRYLPALVEHYLLSGAFYGVLVFFFMNVVVIPLSALPKTHFPLSGTFVPIIVHIFCVGLPDFRGCTNISKQIERRREREGSNARGFQRRTLRADQGGHQIVESSAGADLVIGMARCDADRPVGTQFPRKPFA